MRSWIVLAKLRYMIVRLYEIFSRETFMIQHQKKMIPIYANIRLKFRRSILRRGKKFKTRTKKQIRNVQNVLMGTCIRQTFRERAKQQLLAFCQANYSKAVIHAKFTKCIERIILIQRVFKLYLKIKSHKKTLFSTGSQNIVRASAGLRSIIVVIYKSNLERQQDLFKEHERQQYSLLDDIRAKCKDPERVDSKKVEYYKKMYN